MFNPFSLIVNIRNYYYDNPKNSYHSTIPVVSIGNISVGGTGKTPMVIEMCNIAKKLGLNICVVGRGYKRKSKEDILISNETTNLTPDNTGDEMLLIAQKADVPVLATRSKSNAVKDINNHKYNFNTDIIIIDDGFQHRKLQRYLDIVLIDDNTLKQKNLLPFGRLREPFSSLKRADIIILTKNASKEKLLAIYPTDKPIISATYSLDKPYPLLNNTSPLPNNITALTGISNPNSFCEMLQMNGLTIAKSICYDDHHNYTTSNINKIIKSANAIATTEKDAVKLLQFKDILANIPIFVFPVKVQFDNPYPVIEKLNYINSHI